jgi:hypothetical protein
MEQSQGQPKERAKFQTDPAAGAPPSESATPSPDETAAPPEEQRPPVGPPASTVARLMLTLRVVLALILAVAALNTAVSVYRSQESRWPSDPDSVVVKGRNMIEKAKPYVDGVRYHAKEIFQKDQASNPRRVGIHDRALVALAIFAFIVLLMMETKVVGEKLALADPCKWVGSTLFAFEVVATVGLAGLLTWLGAAMKTEMQTPLLWLFVAYLAAHGVWMVLNYRLLSGGEVPGLKAFLGLGIVSLLFAGTLVAGSFFSSQFRDEIKLVSAASLVCLASSVIGVRMVSDSFFGDERAGKGFRHAVFIIVCIALLALIALVILARR